MPDLTPDQQALCDRERVRRQDPAYRDSLARSEVERLLNWPELIHVEFDICVLCAEGDRGECHSPGCAFWMCDAPSLKFLNTLADRVELRSRG